MQFKIGDTDYRVYWSHDREEKATVCFIRSIQPDGKIHSYSGISVQNGKPVPGSNLMVDSKEKRVSYPEGLKNRTTVWYEYFEMRGKKW